MESGLDRITAYEQDLLRTGRLTPLVKEALAKARDIRSNHDIVYYIAGALTGVPEALKDRYTKTSALIADGSTPRLSMFGYAPHLHGTDPIAHPDVTPQEVRDIDYLFAAVIPDRHINFMEPMSHGAAVEQAWAEAGRIPTTYVVPEDFRLSRLVLGMWNIKQILRYEVFDQDGITQLQEVIETDRRQMHDVNLSGNEG